MNNMFLSLFICETEKAIHITPIGKDIPSLKALPKYYSSHFCDTVGEEHQFLEASGA